MPDFKRESEILGSDFNEAIDKFGGKGAGLLLLEKLGGRIPNYVLIPTNSESLEELVDYDEAHVRSSTTIEDWRDPEYWGTFLTQCFVKNEFIDRSVRYNHAHLKQLMKDDEFDIPKDTKLGIAVMESIKGHSFTVYSSYPPEIGGPCAIEICRQGRASDCPMQLFLVSNIIEEFIADAYLIDSYTTHLPNFLDTFGDPEFQKHEDQKLPNSIEYLKRLNWAISKLEDCIDRLEEDLPHVINTKIKESKILSSTTRSVVSEDTLWELTDYAKDLEKKLGYPVNLEGVFSEDGTYFTQLRPVPLIENYTPLPELEDSVIIAETPFVYGVFKERGKILVHHQKPSKSDTTIFRFNEDLIIVSDENFKGWRHGLYPETQYLALLNPTEATALTHGISIIPPNDKSRKDFKFIGIPGIMKWLEDRMRPVDGEVTADRPYNLKDNFFVTNIEFTVESNGRFGRLYFDRKDWNDLYTNYEAPNEDVPF